jgi:ankyrin repeat protein
MLSVAGTTPLVCAVFDGNIEVMKYLLDRGGNPRKKTPGGLTLLHAAAAKGVFFVPLLFSTSSVRPVSVFGIERQKFDLFFCHQGYANL